MCHSTATCSSTSTDSFTCTCGDGLIGDGVLCGGKSINIGTCCIFQVACPKELEIGFVLLKSLIKLDDKLQPKKQSESESRDK